MHPTGGAEPQRTEGWRDLGPLRPIAVASAVFPTTGALVGLAHLGDLAAHWPGDALGLVAAAGVIAAAVALLLLPPTFAAFAAGFVLGPLGVVPAVLGIGGGALLGLCIWPLLGERLYAFMRNRPRVVAVRQFCTGSLWRCSARVAALRLAVRLPFCVQTLLLSAASTRSAAVAIGSIGAASPVAALAGGLGACVRRWRDDGSWPTFAGGCLVGAAAVATVVATVRARRAWLHAPR